MPCWSTFFTSDEKWRQVAFRHSCSCGLKRKIIWRESNSHIIHSKLWIYTLQPAGDPQSDYDSTPSWNLREKTHLKCKNKLQNYHCRKKKSLIITLQGITQFSVFLLQFQKIKFPLFNGAAFEYRPKNERAGGLCYHRAGRGSAPLNLASLVTGGKTLSGAAGHTQDEEPFVRSHWWGIVTSSCSLTLAMPIQIGKSSFALGTKCCFFPLETHPHLPLLHFSSKPLNSEDEPHRFRSRSLISEAFPSLSTSTSTFCMTLKLLSLLLTWLKMNICVSHWLKGLWWQNSS